MLRTRVHKDGLISETSVHPISYNYNAQLGPVVLLLCSKSLCGGIQLLSDHRAEIIVCPESGPRPSLGRVKTLQD